MKTNMFSGLFGNRTLPTAEEMRIEQEKNDKESTISTLRYELERIAEGVSGNYMFSGNREEQIEFALEKSERARRIARILADRAHDE